MTGLRVNKRYLLKKKKKKEGEERGSNGRGEIKERKKEERKERISFYSVEAREALMSPSRRDRSLLEASTGRDCGAVEARRGGRRKNLIDSPVR